MRIVHAADVHLDSPLKGLKELDGTAQQAVRLATRQAFVNLINLCLEEEAELLLIAGDLFDQEQKDFNAGLFAIRQFARLREVGTAVVIVRGNHDAASTVTKTLRDAKNVDITVLSHGKADSKTFHNSGVVVHGQSFRDSHIRENLICRFPQRREGLFNVGLVHTDVGGSPDAPYAYAPCTLSDLLDRGYDYWALGHNHTRSELHLDPCVIYPGNLQGRHIQETGPKGCTVVHVEGQRVERVVHRPCNTVQWERVFVDAACCASLDDVFDAAHRSLKALRQDACSPTDHPLIARVTIAGDTCVHQALSADPQASRAQIAVCAADWGIWLERVELATAPLDNAGSELPQGFLAALKGEFENLLSDPAAFEEYLAELAPLDQVTQAYQLDGKPSDIDHVRTLLAQSAALVLSRLRLEGSGPLPPLPSPCRDGAAR